MTPDRAMALAADVLVHLSQHPDRLIAFLEATGLSPQDLRRLAQSPELSAALLDHLVQSDDAVLDCAAALNIRPAELMAARTALAGPGSYGWSVD